jgi:beta-lactamase superfamily II metal-dependent hydrolase
VTTRSLGEDLVRVRGDRRDENTGEVRRGRVLRTLYWGDEIDFADEDQNRAESVRDVEVRFYDETVGEMRPGFVRKRRENGNNRPIELRPPGADKLLRVTFAELHRGDATLIRTPGGRHVLIDGAEEPCVTRLLHSAFTAEPAADPFVLDALVLSHGDGEHFAGLAAIADDNRRPRSFGGVEVRASRYYHNGLVKRAEKRAGRRVRESDRLGVTRNVHGERFVTDLHDDPRNVPGASRDFARWGAALGALVTSNGAVLRRLRAGDHDAFDFLLGEEIEVLVLGPVEEPVQGQPALRLLCDEDGAPSSARTIERQSVMLKLTYGNVRMLIGGELGADGARRALDWASSHCPPVALESEIYRVPHHGAGPLLSDFFRAVAPVVSVVTACDAEPVEPRAHPSPELLEALGRYSRGDRTAVLSTRSVQIRTDGERVFVAPEPADGGLEQPWAFLVDRAGGVTPTDWAMV